MPGVCDRGPKVLFNVTRRTGEPKDGVHRTLHCVVRRRYVCTEMNALGTSAQRRILSKPTTFARHAPAWLGAGTSVQK